MHVNPFEIWSIKVKDRNARPNICTFFTERSDAWGKCARWWTMSRFFLFVCVLFCFVFPFLHHRPMFRSCFGFFFNRTTFKGCVQGACLTLAQPVLGLLFRGGRCRYSTSLRPAASASRCTVCFLATVFDIRVVWSFQWTAGNPAWLYELINP